MSTLIKRARDSPVLSTLWGHSKDSHLWTRKKALTSDLICQCLDLWLQPLELWIINFCCSQATQSVVFHYSSPNGLRPGGSDVKESAFSVGDLGSIPRSGKSPGEGNRLPTPVFLPRKLQGQRSLEAYSPWGCIQSDTTEPLTLHNHCPSQSSP